MAATHLVKKYPNRKLYDTVTRRYVTLDVIADLVRQGSAVQVVEQASGDDITAATLEQASNGGGQSRRAATRRTPAARRAPRPASARTPVKGGSSPLTAVIRASLALPQAVGQRALDTLSAAASLEALRPGKRGGASAAEVAQLRGQVRALTREVERLNGELAELRPLGHGGPH